MSDLKVREQAVAHLAAKDRRISLLEMHLERMRGRLRKLAAYSKPKRHERLVEKACDDARLIMLARFEGGHASRDALSRVGIMTPYAHGWAHGVLKALKLDGLRHPTKQELEDALSDIEAYERRLLGANSERALRELRSNAGARYVRDPVRAKMRRDEAKRAHRAGNRRRRKA